MTNQKDDTSTSENSEKKYPYTDPTTGAVTIELLYPNDVKAFAEEGTDLTHIELKRPKGKHIKGLTKDVGMTDIFKIAGKVSGYTTAFFDELDAADCLQVSEVIGDFLDGGQETGRTA